MGSLQLNPMTLYLSTPNIASSANPNTHNHKLVRISSRVKGGRTKIRAIRTATPTETSTGTDTQLASEEETPPSMAFAFVNSVLLPDGTPDIHIRTAKGGQKLRDVMLDGYIDLYGPYDSPLLNCAGCGSCGTCIVEVVEGKEHLSPRTEKEKELLKKKPKAWRLACQTMVGKEDSRGQVVIQQLPEWKAHDWDK